MLFWVIVIRRFSRIYVLCTSGFSCLGAHGLEFFLAVVHQLVGSGEGVVELFVAADPEYGAVRQTAPVGPEKFVQNKYALCDVVCQYSV